MVAPDGGNIVWADFNEKDDQYFGAPYWSKDGSSLWVQWMNRLQDNLIIWAVDPSNGTKKTLYNERQKTWIDLDDDNRLRFLDDSKNFILESDKTGWNHLYLMDVNGNEINPITSGKFTVLDIKWVDEKNKIVYFTARSRENTARTDFYRVDMSGKNLQRLTFGEIGRAHV